jgi:gliding motility-associated-like protein
LNGLLPGSFLPNLITDYLIDTIKTPCSYPLAADFGTVPSCFPSPFSFVDNTSGEPESWEWDFDDPTSGASNLSSLQNPAHTFTSVGTYNVELIVTRGCRLDTISQLITISSSYVYSGTVNICSGDSALIHGVNQTVAGVYTDTLSSTSGCDSVVSITLSIFPLATSNNSQNICQGDSILLGGSFQTTAGVYNDTISGGSANGCDSVVFSTLIVDPLPVVSFSSTPNTGLLPLSVDFMNTSTGADIYSWDFGDGGISASTDPSYVYLTEGDFTVMLTASSADGCAASFSFSYVNVSDLVELLIPNVFTPNGDGKNDNFYVMSVGVESVHMGIFNRWGQLLSEWTTIGAYWDGRSMSGELAPEGTYFYVYSAITIGGEVLRQNGAITLLR